MGLSQSWFAESLSVSRVVSHDDLGIRNDDVIARSSAANNELQSTIDDDEG